MLLLFLSCDIADAVCLVLVWCTHCGEAPSPNDMDYLAKWWGSPRHVSHAALSFVVPWIHAELYSWTIKQSCIASVLLFHVFNLLSVLFHIDCVVCIDCVVLHQLVCLCCSSHQWGLWGVDSFLLVLLEYSIGVVVVVLFDGVCSDCSMFWLSFSIVYYMFSL